jgi:hypothetical protein
MKWEWKITHMEDLRNVPNILVGKPESKRQFARRINRQLNNIKMDLKKKWAG